MEFYSGFGRADITCFIPGLGMMGYAQPHNIVKEIATPLWARAMVLKDQEGKLLALIHLELAFVSMSIKEEVLRLLKTNHPEWDLKEDNLLITAQHTHSAPGGFSHYPFYNFSIPGHQTQVLKTISENALMALDEAMNSLAPSTLTFGEIEISADKEVAFNRSLAAYVNNHDVTPIKEKELAADRRMRGLLVRSPEGKLKAMINWFGVHCTNISSYNQRIHHDNKGIAADLFEKNHPGTFAFFLQSAAGDISPNFVWDKSIKRLRGKFSDQYESAAFNGEIQFRESEKIADEIQIKGTLASFHSFFDMREIASAPAHGVAFFKGTLEGPAMPEALAPAISLLARSVRKARLVKNPELHQDFYDHQFPKDVMLDHRDGSFIGFPVSAAKKLPKIPDLILESFRKQAKADSLKTLPWVPVIIPFQLIRLGQILLVTIPGEITTIAAKRLEATIQAETKSLGIEHVIITSYANAYMGYVTTPEEYMVQCYEGGHTVYGRKTLEAVTQASLGLVAKLKGEPYPFTEQNRFYFPADELARRSF